MFACVCWTPFQILNALNYKFTHRPEEEMDMYICEKFSQADAIAERLATLKYVNKVYLVKNLDYDSLGTIKRKIKICRDLFCISKVIKSCVRTQIDLENITYSAVVSSGYLNFNILFNNYFCKKGAKSIFIDDGLESYLKENTSDNYSLLYRLASKISGNGGTNLSPEELYVYMPEIVEAKSKYKKIGELPALTKYPEYIRKDFNYIFGYKKLVNEYRFMLFDQVGTGDFRNPVFLQIQRNILDMLIETVGEKQLLVKMHPRAEMNVYGNKYRTFSTSIPWEIFVMNEYISNKILLSITSTACFTPKIVFGEEPTVIFMYKLFKIENSLVVEEFIQKVKKTYRNPQNVYIPESFEELKKVILELK